MTDLVPIRGGDLTAASTDDLRAELARGLTLTAEVLTRLGAIWLELERRGEDLSALKSGLARTLPLIASGVLAAEAVVAFAGRPAVLRAIEGIPLERQRSLASGEPVEVIDPTSPAESSRMPLGRLPARMLSLLFHDGEERPASVQRMAFRERLPRAAPEEKERRYRPRYDAANGIVMVGKMTVALADLLTELSSAAGPDHTPEDRPDEYLTFRVRLRPEEMDRFQGRCRAVGLPDWEMARKALRAFGLI